jgi:tocopherol cyclase|tara:strand:+ start:10337 stop:11755 length:1419 start_codon:yes stop_codon:yes gene_type:complete
MRSAFSVSSSSSSNGSAPKFTPAPHSGYHRRGNVNPNRNKSQSFFEGWYFRLSISREQSVSLIYHVYDPDDENSKRHSAGAQIIGPNGEYIYKESRKVRENFKAEAHELALQLEFDTAVKKPKLDTNRREFYRVSDRGTKHAGYICTSESNKNDIGNIDSPWKDSAVLDYIEWDIDVTPLKTYGSGNGTGKDKEDVGVSPAGWLTSLPLLEPHYQILFAHALATGYIECDGKRTEFIDAPFYAEKNWGGGGFPRKWFWMQCNSFPHYPDLSVACTGANRGVVISPGTYEDVGMIAVHFGDLFVQFTPIGASKSTKTNSSYVGENVLVKSTTFEWKVHPWGSWEVVAKGDEYECFITGTCEHDLSKCKTTVLRAPAPDTETGMLPLCRETFSGDMTVSMYKIDKKNIRIPVFENASSGSTACLEVGGGPWEEPWEIQADVRDPLAGALAMTDVNVDLVQSVGKVFGLDVIPGL